MWATTIGFCHDDGRVLLKMMVCWLPALLFILMVGRIMVQGF